MQSANAKADRTDRPYMAESFKGSPVIPKGQLVVAPAVVERMKRLATGQTDAALNDRFGISYNTWRKLKDGHPVRRSVAVRLVERVDRIEHHSSGSQC